MVLLSSSVACVLQEKDVSLNNSLSHVIDIRDIIMENIDDNSEDIIKEVVRCGMLVQEIYGLDDDVVQRAMFHTICVLASSR